MNIFQTGQKGLSNSLRRTDKEWEEILTELLSLYK